LIENNTTYDKHADWVNERNGVMLISLLPSANVALATDQQVAEQPIWRYPFDAAVSKPSPFVIL
jgi:hypothetical protein